MKNVILSKQTQNLPWKVWGWFGSHPIQSGTVDRDLPCNPSRERNFDAIIDYTN